ncbi:hypothetical protein BV898_17735 [Hypsibius exemplaris]|uniref:Putative auto-transporter adhesin head GIN domain-containing protein n=1 Tax=Hypsibius exemplaris TaxID=2072580 RepID=A0A9X6RMQ2_HYPEX|nr:hypothetical protein BV898_17735 [Hypsibius exemplaris]
MLKGSLFLLLGVCLLIAECVTGDPIGAQIGQGLDVKKVDSDEPRNRNKRECDGREHSTKEKTRYTGVRAGAAFKVSITINGQEGVTVHAPDEAILALVETVVVDGILVVRFKPTVRSVKGVVFIAISAIRCSSIDTEGSCSVTVTPAVREDSIRLAVESSRVTANLQGSSILDVSGSATAGQITAQGSSQFNGLDLRLTTAQVTGQGSSQIAIAVSTSVTGSLHGSAQVQLRGQPQVRNQRSGSANVLNV